MAFEYIKQLAKEYTYSHKVGKNIDTFIEQAQEALLKDDIQEYEHHLQEVNQEIRRLQDQKNTVFTNFGNETDELKAQYLQDINKHVEFLKDLQKNYQVITAEVNPMKDSLPNLSNNIKDNVAKIDRFVTDLNDLKSAIKKDSTDAVNQFKQSIKEWVDKEKKQLTAELKKYYEQKQGEIDKHFELSQQEQQEREKMYWVEGLEILTTMKKEWVFVKYSLFLVLTIFAILFDYFLICSDFQEIFQDYFQNFPIIKSLFTYWLPIIFVSVILFWDVLNRKLFHLKWIKYVIYSFIFLLLFLPLVNKVGGNLSLFWANITQDSAETWRLIARICVYLILVPITIFCLNLMEWKYFKIYVPEIRLKIKSFFKKLFSPITRLFGVIARFCKPLEIKSRVSLSKFGIKFDGLPKDEIQSTIDLSNTFSHNINALENQITHIKNFTEAVVDKFQWWNEILNVNIENLRRSFSQISEMLDSSFNKLREKKIQSDADIDNMINRLALWVKQKEENLKEARRLIQLWVLEAIREWVKEE